MVLVFVDCYFLLLQLLWLCLFLLCWLWLFGAAAGVLPHMEIM